MKEPKTEITNHTTSLEISKRLKELKLKQESLFYWDYCEANDSGGYREWLDVVYISDVVDIDDTVASSYLASELGEMAMSSINGTPLELLKVFDLLLPYPLYAARYFDQSIFGKSDKSMSNAMAYLIINLIENNIVNYEWKKRWLYE